VVDAPKCEKCGNRHWGENCSRSAAGSRRGPAPNVARSEENRRGSPVSLRFSTPLLEKIDEAARRAGVSRTDEIQARLLASFEDGEDPLALIERLRVAVQRLVRPAGGS